MKFLIIALIVFIVVDHSFQGKYDQLKSCFIIFNQESCSTPAEAMWTKFMFWCMREYGFDSWIANEIISWRWRQSDTSRPLIIRLLHQYGNYNRCSYWINRFRCFNVWKTSLCILLSLDIKRYKCKLKNKCI